MNSVGNLRDDGFTIIEVIFFLAISAGLVVALLGTVGFAITRQRFSDSVVGVQAYVQSEYNETLNVISDSDLRAGSCSLGADDTTVLSGGSLQRGTSSGATTCVVLGKALEFSNDTPDRITSYNVIGREPTDPSDQTGAALLKQYAPAIDESSAQAFDTAWGAKIIGVRKAGSDGGLTRLLFLRSPDSGLIQTFGGTGGTSLLPALNDGTGTFNVCIQSADLTNAISLVSLAPVAGTEGVTTKFDLTGTERGASC